ncbi:PLDc N-terminal domain-containing protein [Alcanivorax sp. JB21]|uniref:phospholipase D-like domain-containing protein n=1 Tax=Alcanivorax limicola TaxID=2874102 RepID=UPI001CBF856F|nr:phospholipase D-like domain-containing protein [Alcanivorax limicola]MBZ2188294.1 PLDc N-terminal domain-containing protein [Alcanivorax limicola]
MEYIWAGLEPLGRQLYDYWPGLVAFSSLVVAVLAMSHAVMHKRDARAAAAWTGLIWLLPLIGAVLYLLLGVNRIQRRARQIAPDSLTDTPDQMPVVQPRPRASHLHTLAELSGRLTGLPLLNGNALDVMDAPDALAAMTAAIDEASDSIFLVTYIFGNDAAGRPLVDALAAAAKRGVQVRVLIDGMGALYTFPSIVRRLRRRGVIVERFLYSLAPWRMPYMNLRNHRKVMIVDRRIGFTGGMNLRAGYVQQPPDIRDLHARIEGPVVEHLLRSFAADWYFTCREHLNQEYVGTLDAGPILARGISAGPDADLGKRRLTLLAAIGSAQYEVRIMTPYFVPDQTLLTALQLACMRGVRVTLILPGRNNLRLVHWASLHMLPWLVNDGCELYFSGEPFDHSKVMTVDGHWALLGSGNWDARSLRLNFEFDLECYDEALVAMLNRRMDMRRANARRVSLDDMHSQPYLKRLRNGVAYVLEPYL